MFDVQPATASRILSDLVGRGILVKTSTAQRGPSVTYGPGPKFPLKGTRQSQKHAKQQLERDWEGNDND